MNSTWGRRLLGIGALRLGLASLVLLSLPLPLVETPSASPWSLILGQVAPAVALMLAWVVLFDLLMARVFLSLKPAELRPHYLGIIRIDAGLLGLQLVCWGPFFISALSRP